MRYYVTKLHRCRDSARTTRRGRRPLKIWIDADGCPVKDEVYRVAERYKLKVILVANKWMRHPDRDWITLEVVKDLFDAADDYDILWAKGKLRYDVLDSQSNPYQGFSVGAEIEIFEVIVEPAPRGRVRAYPAVPTGR